MISLEDREKIRRAYFIENKSMRQIARELGHSRDTVKKAIESAEPATYTIRKPRAAPVLGPYKARIDELLAENEHLPRKQRYTGHKIYEDITAKGYKGSESNVRHYIAQQRREKRRRPVYIPLEFDPGTDAQVDWGEAIAIIAGERVTVQLFLMRLCYSRRLFVMAFPTQKQEAFTSASSVQASKGTFRLSITFRVYHVVSATTTCKPPCSVSLRQAQDRPGRTQPSGAADAASSHVRSGIVFRSHYLLESHFCTPGQGHEKGRVEKGVGFSRRNPSTSPGQASWCLSQRRLRFRSSMCTS